METIVIVGANVAGGRAAEALRENGFDGHVFLIGAEPERPYERPPLSKQFLWGETAERDVYLRPRDFYSQQNIEVLLGTRAVQLDKRDRAVDLDNGRRLHFDKLLIATGASPRRLGVPGGDLDGVIYLRTLADAREITRRMEDGQRVVVVGMGFIGAEVAASCRRRGLEVVALEAGEVPLERAFGREIGHVYAEVHRQHGVDLRTGQQVAEFRGTGKLERVVTRSGAEIECDFAVVGIGVSPETAWLGGSGVTTENGVVTDAYCRTNVPNVFAAGDVANWWHPEWEERVRVEHFDNAERQGGVAAANMLGQQRAYAPIPYFWSDQYDLGLEYVGYGSGADELAVRGMVQSGTWAAFYVRHGALRAALAVNRPDDLQIARRLMQQRVRVTAAELSDEQRELGTLLQRRSA